MKISIDELHEMVHAAGDFAKVYTYRLRKGKKDPRYSTAPLGTVTTGWELGELLRAYGYVMAGWETVSTTLLHNGVLAINVAVE